MEVILLERIERLGQMGDVVNVKDGFARNFLLPKNKALRANKVNREYFEKEKINLEAKNLKQKSEAETVSDKKLSKIIILSFAKLAIQVNYMVLLIPVISKKTSRGRIFT